MAGMDSMLRPFYDILVVICFQFPFHDHDLHVVA